MFGYLPLEDQIRARRVDKTFHRIGQLAISHTKSMSLTEDRFKNLTPDQMSVILELCSPKLEMIKFPNEGHNGIPLASMLANYECPRLTDLDLGQSVVDYSIFERIIRNVPNIESLAWNGQFVGFPNIVVDSLKKLKLGYVNNEIIESLTGRFPNLKEVYLIIENSFTSNVLDEFFASIPQVHLVDIEFTKAYLVYFEKEMVIFWNLPLTSLRMESVVDGCPGDTFLQKVVTSFPHLQTLRISPIDANDDGVAALALLHELEILELGLGLCVGVNMQIRHLVACKKLRKLNLRFARITVYTFAALFQNCPKLDHVSISNIVRLCCFGVATPAKAAAVLRGLSLTGIGKRDITIEFHGDPHDADLFKSNWETEPTKAAIQKLEETDELKIKISWKEFEDDGSEEMDESMDLE